MAKQLAYEITTDPSKGIAGLKQFSGAVKKSMKDVDSSVDDSTTNAQKLAKALSGLASDMESEMKGAAKAADALGKALGPELTSRTDLASVVVDLKKMGISFDEITADADVLAGSLRELDSVRLSGAGAGMKDIADSSTRARDGVDEIGKSAGSSKNALANMIGNSAQDLGAFGGIAGSAGVALGQLAEFAADAKLEGEGLGSIASNFATVVGPVAALSIGVGLVTHAWDSYKKSQEAAKKATEDASLALEEQLGLTDKLKDVDFTKATTAAQQFNTALIKNEEDRAQAIRSLGLLGTTSDKLGQTMIGLERDSRGTLTALAEAGGIPKEYAAGVAKAVDESENFGQIQGKLIKQFGAVKGFELAKEYDAQVRALERLNDAQQKTDTTTTAQNALDLARGTDTATAALVDQAEAQAKAKNANADAVDILNEFVPLQQQAAENLDGAAKATERFTASQGELSTAIDEATTALRDQQKFLEDQLSAAATGADLGITLEKAEHKLTDAVQARKDALDEANKAAPEDRKKASDAYVKAVEEERDAVIDAAKAQQRYREEQATAQGNVLTATQKVDGLNDSLEEQAKKAGPEAQKSVYNYLIQLNEIPEDKQTAIYAAVDAGKLDEANTLIDEASKSREVALNVDVDTTEAMKKLVALGAFIRDQFKGMGVGEAATILDAGGTAGGFGGIAGERGPEILNRRYLTTGPTYVPPGTRVTSRKQTAVILRSRGTRGLKRFDAGGVVPGATNINVSLHSAVIGSTYDVMNAVNTAVRRAERLLPRHG